MLLQISLPTCAVTICGHYSIHEATLFIPNDHPCKELKVFAANRRALKDNNMSKNWMEIKRDLCNINPVRNKEMEGENETTKVYFQLLLTHDWDVGIRALSEFIFHQKSAVRNNLIIGVQCQLKVMPGDSF